MINTGSSNKQEDEQLVLVIKEDQISVAPDNQIKIHVAVVNNTPNEDYFDIAVKGVPADWTAINTPVVRVPARGVAEVILTIQPPPVPQSRVGQYPLDVHAVSQSNPTHSATARSTLTVALYESRGQIGVLLDSIHFSIAPGSTIYIPILLQNRASEEDNFQLTIEGIPANWISTNSTVTNLEPSMSKEVLITIHAPQSSAAHAGRTPFKIQFTSQAHPDQSTEVECILTVSAFSNFSASLQPENLESGQPGNLIINNEGNTEAAYTLSFQSSANLLMFEKGIPVPIASPQAGEQLVEIQYVEIPQGDIVQVSAGTKGIYPFRANFRSRPIIGNVRTYPFAVTVVSTENKSVDLSGELSQKGLIPVWLATTTLIGLLLLCVFALLLFPAMNNNIPAIQTASFNQTQAALSGQVDSDSDGLINSDELKIGTDPFKADTDGDGLPDGEEVNIYKTNPLIPDTDQDGLSDGEEVQKYKTNPLNPDTDGDRLSDGDEVKFGTDPLQPDTDKDGLLDGQENQTCPRPLVPDSDGDGIIDGRDLEPCNPANPALTATVLASGPTPGATSIPTSIPTNIPATLIAPTNPPLITPTAILPNIQGIVLFESNRDGNSEVYAMNLANQSMSRLTNNSAVDTQPALAPDSLRVAYVSNQNGNNEIYLTGLDLRTPVNLTNNPADDQKPTWSPDGNWIAFTSNRNGNQDIYIMRSDGTEIHQLTNDPANDFAPTWFSVRHLLSSEDWIAFTSDRDGNLEIYKIKPDGTGLTNLTKNPANDYSPSGPYDGGLLAFVTDRDGNPEIYIMTDEGGALTNVTNSFAQDLDPALARNQDWILFSSDRDGNLEVYLVGTGGGNIYNLTRNPNEDRYPDW